MLNQATASDLPFCDTFIPQKAKPKVVGNQMESWQTKKWGIGEKSFRTPVSEHLQETTVDSHTDGLFLA